MKASGERGGIRTLGNLIKSQVLYLLSYTFIYKTVPTLPILQVGQSPVLNHSIQDLYRSNNEIMAIFSLYTIFEIYSIVLLPPYSFIW